MPRRAAPARSPRVARLRRAAVIASTCAVLGAVPACSVGDAAPISHPITPTSPGADPVEARAGVTYIVECGGDARVQRPASIDLDCDDAHNGRLEDLAWQRWGEERATAEGTLAMNDCYPDCARGTQVRYGVGAVADQLVEGEGAATYRRLTVTTLEETDGMVIQQVFHLPGIGSDSVGIQGPALATSG